MGTRAPQPNPNYLVGFGIWVLNTNPNISLRCLVKSKSAQDWIWDLGLTQKDLIKSME